MKNANEYDGTGISFLLIAVIWTTLIIALGGLHYHLAFQATLENARSAARHSFGKDQAFRKWATLHGGVYVPVTDETRPNPYLSHVLEREVKTESGRILTLINPAYMVRQAHKTADQLFGTKSHITSLKPTRKETAPDAWEADALASFENGELEQSSLVKLDGKPYLRLMRPMVVEEGCLKCHNAQGYKVGDIRGGISVAIPWQPYRASLVASLPIYCAGYGVLWMLGLLFNEMNRRRVKRQMLKRRQAEEELLGHKLLRQTFFQNNHAAMLIFDTVEGRILDANPAARKFYGYDKKTFSDMMISELSVVPLESIWTKFKDLQNIGSDHFESRHKLANGEIKDVEVYAGSINLGSKQVLYAIIHDITHRKQAEVAFSRKNAEFERFVHTVAHDLHNPLLTIRSMLNLFLGEMKENKDPESQRDLIYIKSAADSMHEKIGGLLQLSKASHISSAVFSMEVDFLDIIDLCRSSIVEKNKGMNHLLDIQVCESTITLHGNPVGFEKIWQKLLESATANIREGRIRTVKTGFVQQQNEVVFYVRDNESGIDPNDKEQIFETFFDYSSQARGVGLALVKKLVESYGGRIWVESKGLGKECCIKFTLPEAVKPASSQRDQKGQTI